MQAKTNASHDRYAFLDVCRAVAAIAVMLQHAGEAAGYFGLKATDFSHGVFSFGQMGVVLFFLISGYIIPKSLESSGNLKKFFVRRVFRIYPLYFFIMAVTVALSVYLKHQPLATPPAFLAHLIFIQSWIGLPNYVGGSWTLFIELLWYVLFACIFVLGLNRRNFVVFYAPMVGMLALAALSVVLEIRLPFGRFSMIMACFMGLLWMRLNDGAISKRFFLLTLITYALTLFIAFYVGFDLLAAPNSDGMTLLAMTNTWVIGIAFFALAYRLRLKAPVLQYLGLISYSIYLVHSPVIMVLEHMQVPSVLMMPATFALTIGLGALTYRFVEAYFTHLGRKVS